MKKLFSIAAIAAMCLTGCTNKANTAEESLDFEEATPEAVVSSLVEKVQSGDATAITEAVQTVQTELSKLLENGNVEKVTEYANQIQAFVQENAETLKGFNIDITPLTNIINQVKALPGNAEDAAEGAIEAAQADAEDAVNDAVDAGKNAVDATVEDAKTKANQAVEDAKTKANQAVEDAVETGKAKTNEAIQKAADKLKL